MSAYIATLKQTNGDGTLDISALQNETGLCPITWHGGLMKFQIDGSVLIGQGANGQSLGIKVLTELTTIAASATTTTTIQLPAKAIILAVPVRVTVALPVTTNFTVGDAGSAARYSTAAVSKAIDSTDPGTKAGAYYNATAAGVVLTPDSTPSDTTGRVRVSIYYIDCTPPTS